MTRSDKRIEGGYILYPRQLIELLADAPLLDRALWIWLICRAAHADRSGPAALARGQLVTTLDDLVIALRWRHGSVMKKPNKTTVRRALERLGARRLVDTRQTTRGMVVTICDYDRYQDPTSYVRRPYDMPLDAGSAAQAASHKQEGKEGKKERGTSSSFSRRPQTFDQVARSEAREALDQAAEEFLADG